MKTDQEKIIELKRINRELIQVVNDLKAPSSGGGSFYLTLQHAEQVIKKAEELNITL